MPKQQSTLDAFLGVKKAQEKGSQQKKLDSYFGNKKTKDATATSAEKQEAKETETKGSERIGKENDAQPPKDDGDDGTNIANRMTDDDDEDSPKSVVVKRKKPTTGKGKATSKRRRRVIEDDDSDDDDDDGQDAAMEGSNNNSENAATRKAVDNTEKKDNTHTDSKKTRSSEANKKKTSQSGKGKKQEKLSKDPTSDKPKSSSDKSDNNRSKTSSTQTAKDQNKNKSNAQNKGQKSKSSSSKSAGDKQAEDKDASANNKSEVSPADVSLPKRLHKSPILKAAGKQFKSNEAIWKHLLEQLPEGSLDQPLPYSVLCAAFERIEAITARLQIQEIMTTLFRQILILQEKLQEAAGSGAANKKGDNIRPYHDLFCSMYLSCNDVAPAYQCVELGIGDAILIKAVSEACGTSTAAVKSAYEKQGDLGLVAQSCKSKQRTLGGFFKSTSKTTASNNRLTCAEVLSVFREIAETKGNQSQKFKVDKIKRLLVKAGKDSAECKYILRGLQGKLRIGLAQSTCIISLAHAMALTIPNSVVTKETDDVETEDDDFPEEANQYMDSKLAAEKRLEAAANIVKKAYSELPSYDAVIEAALKVPLEHLHTECSLQPGIPVAPMLAKPTKSIQEVLKRLNGLEFTCEYKYDGERAQIHQLPDGKTTKVFSRNLLDTSEKYPEVPLFVNEAAAAAKRNVDSFVLDAEVVAYNSKTEQLVPFQVLSTRKQKEESADSAKVQVIVQAFDLMYLNGSPLLNKSLKERRKLLREHFEAVPGKFQFAKSLDHTENGDTAVLEEFLEAAVKGQCEGLMVKTLTSNAAYEPSKRSLNWLKLKKDYLQGLGDSVDLVVLGAYHGRGKRTGVYGAYLLACYDPDTEEFQSVCKIGTGFSDEDLKTLAEDLNKHTVEVKSSQYNVSDVLECDVWFDAVQVWEVKAADLSKSSAHRGAAEKTGEAGRGIGLRFPRFERVRTDKKPDQATTSDQILEMYYQQDAIVADNDEDAGAMMDDDGI